MNSAAPTMSKEKAEYARYTTTKVDVDIMHLVKAAAALDKQNVQDWLSDLANAAAAKRLGQPPVKRKPPKPRD